jgi:hypothetical protein
MLREEHGSECDLETRYAKHLSASSRPKLAWRVAPKVIRRSDGAFSCVDGPRLARDNSACSIEVVYSHVSGLLMQPKPTAGPDGVREPRPTRECRSAPRSHSPDGARDHSQAPATDRIDLLPSGIRSPRSGPRRIRLKACRNGAKYSLIEPGFTLSSTPTTGIADCCARAASGHTTAAPSSSVMNLASP